MNGAAYDTWPWPLAAIDSASSVKVSQQSRGSASRKQSSAVRRSSPGLRGWNTGASLGSGIGDRPTVSAHGVPAIAPGSTSSRSRSEEHTSELQSQFHL